MIADASLAILDCTWSTARSFPAQQRLPIRHSRSQQLLNGASNVSSPPRSGIVAQKPEETAMSEPTVREVAHRYFDALGRGDIPTALACLADDVEWVNLPKTPGVSDIIPWLGT